MKNDSLRIVVDSNVWVDNYCPWHAKSDDARRFLQNARLNSATLFYPVHVLKDVVYVVRHEYLRKARKDKNAVEESDARAIAEIATACMRNMSELATAVGADASDIWLADKYLGIHPDFEDNLVLAACKRCDAQYLVTNDQRLIKHSNVLSKTPAQMLPLLAFIDE